MVEVVGVQEGAQIAVLAGMAERIWTEHYAPIIGQEQVDYMLSRFQSPEAIKTQIEDGYCYYLLAYNRKEAGYFSVLPKKDMFLSKLYVEKAYRGFGIARKAICHIENLCKDLDMDRIWLTVNKHNYNSIEAYKRLGFVISEEVVQDIGRGFIMDDYKMEKILKYH